MVRSRGGTTQGAGIFDVFSKVANSALAKKVINSAVGKKVIQQATKENLKKAVNSALGKQLQTAVVKGVADASEKAANATLQKFGISSPVIPPGFVAKTVEKAGHSGLRKLGLVVPPSEEKAALDKVFAATTLLPAPKKKARKRKIISTQRPGRRKKTKRARASSSFSGTGIIWE